jgi:hypothetical protein
MNAEPFVLGDAEMVPPEDVEKYAVTARLEFIVRYPVVPLLESTPLKLVN